MDDSPNVQTIKRVVERWNAGDRKPPLDDAHPEIEIDTEISSDDGKVIRLRIFRDRDEALEALDPARQGDREP